VIFRKNTGNFPNSKAFQVKKRKQKKQKRKRKKKCSEKENLL
jgi:hypothetical protein